MSPAPLSMDRRALLRRGAVTAAGAAALTTAGAASGIVSASAASLSFTPITPYRAYDSRNDDNNDYAESGQMYRIPVLTDEFGDSKISAAKAVAFSFTIIPASAEGWITMLPGDVTAKPTYSMLNVTGKGVIANTGGIVALGQENFTDSVNVYCAGNGRIAYLIDVMGYFN